MLWRLSERPTLLLCSLLRLQLECNVGSSVVISQLFGAKDYTTMKTAVSTCLCSIIGLSVFLTLIGFIFCNPLMTLIHTPENIFDDAALYMRIYIAGILFLFLYNICTGIFNALGDSKTPLYLLIMSSVGNIILDYIFVVYCKWAVAGVAWATFIAQGFSCIVAFIILMGRLSKFHPEIKAPHFSFEMLKKISYMSIPSILQQSFVSVGNIFIQSLINSFGSAVIAGYSAANETKYICSYFIFNFRKRSERFYCTECWSCKT